jgi:hypothetical protein
VYDTVKTAITILELAASFITILVCQQHSIVMNTVGYINIWIMSTYQSKQERITVGRIADAVCSICESPIPHSNKQLTASIILQIYSVMHSSDGECTCFSSVCPTNNMNHIVSPKVFLGLISLATDISVLQWLIPQEDHTSAAVEP